MPPQRPTARGWTQPRDETREHIPLSRNDRTGLGLALGRLGVDAPHGRLAQALTPRQARRADPVVTALEHHPVPRFGTAPAGPDPRQWLDEAFGAVRAAVAPAPNHQLARIPKAVQVAHPMFLSTQAAELDGSAAWAGARRSQHLEVNPHHSVAFVLDDAVSRKR